MAIERLLEIMRRLRDPERGCPWDREQTWASIAPHTIEEAYEIADAVERGDARHVRDELGDLLFQVVFQSRIAEEQGLFRFDDVVNAISDKLERRHPHVFGDASIGSAAEQTAAWERHKAEERKAKGGEGGVLDGVTLGLPALSRAAKLGQRAARVGFDWTDTAGVLDKMREELEELEHAVQAGDSSHVREELGDFLFSVAQLARHLEVDPEGALRDAGGKFERRFRTMEKHLEEQGRTPSGASAAELEALWAQAKREIG
jgi:tetrapyrrole methylase family protein/MazG family protein/ATP diphosphatase